jgi:phage terminase small subunit
MDMARVPSKDAVQAINDLAESRIHAFVAAYAIMRPQVQAGKVKLVAMTNRRFNPGTSAEFTQTMDDQLKTVKRIGDTLGIKPASAGVAGAQPGETIGAKTAQ